MRMQILLNKVQTALKDMFRPIWYKVKEKAYMVAYLLYKYFAKKPHILSFDETINYILNHRCCVSRFGDGEIVLMLGQQRIGFQDLVPELSRDLLNSFNSNNPRVFVCLKGLFFKSKFGSKERKFYEYYFFECYRHFLKYIDYEYTYGAADFTRFYEPSSWAWADFNELEEYVERIKRIWKNQNVIFVEGEKTKLGLGNDLFNNVNSIKRILCPSENAYSFKEQIFQAIIKHSTKDDLILLALGPTATILASELGDRTNLWAVDIGHIDIVYFWMKNRCKEKMNIEGKHVNEAMPNSPRIKIQYDMDLYRAQIVEIIR